MMFNNNHYYLDVQLWWHDNDARQHMHTESV